MRHSRHVALLIIILSCFLGLVLWKTPQVVLTTLAEPYYSDSPRVAVQRFWEYMDSRQLELAEKLVLNRELSPAAKHEIEIWEDMVEKNPLLTLQKLEFVDTSDPYAIVVRVYWNSPLREEQSVTYSFGTKKTSEGWRINQLKRITALSLAIGADW